MAEKIVNCGIEFAYVSNNIEIELKRELEKYFLYQTIIVIDKYFEFGAEISNLRSNAMCKIQVERNIESIKDIDNVSCIIAVNNHDVDKIKSVCYQKNIPYIFALTNICDSSCFKNYYFADEMCYKDCNYPMGIVFSVNNVFNFSEFISRAILEISSLSFCVLQNKINNLFFQKNKQDVDLSVSKKILQDLQNFITNNDISKNSVIEICKIYLSYCIYEAKISPNLLDNLLNLYKKYNRPKNIIETKYVFSLLISSLEKNFFKYYTIKFKNAVDYQKHTDYLLQAKQISNFRQQELPDTKINFLLQEFRYKLLEYVKTQMVFEKYIKSQIAEKDIDYFYNIFSNINDIQFTNLLCLEPDIFKDTNFLSLMYSSGLLNFDF